MSNQMHKDRIFTIIIKEWKSTVSNLNSLLFMTLVPVIIIIQLLVMIFIISNFIDPAVVEGTIVGTALKKLEEILPAMANLPFNEKFQVFFFLLFPIYGLIIPTMISISFSTFSIIEEKTMHTLEPLLATPVQKWEILLGKSLAGSIPAVLLTWICAGLFFIGILILKKIHLFQFILTPPLLISLFINVPLITVLCFMLGIMVSSIAKDAKNAQSIGVLVGLPIFGLCALQILGFIPYRSGIFLFMALCILLLDALTLWGAARLLNRETMIIKWKN